MKRKGGWELTEEMLRLKKMFLEDKNCFIHSRPTSVYYANDLLSRSFRVITSCRCSSVRKKNAVLAAGISSFLPPLSA